MIAHVQCCNGNQIPMQQSFTTFSTFLEMRATLLQPLVGRFSVSNFETWPTTGQWQCLAVKSPPRDVGWQIYWWIGIAWVPNKLINTCCTFVEVLVAPLQPSVGRHLASDWAKISKSAQHLLPHQPLLWWFVVMIAHVQCCNGNQIPMQQSFTTFSTFLEMRATLLQPLVGRVCVWNFKTQPTPGQCLAV